MKYSIFGTNLNSLALLIPEINVDNYIKRSGKFASILARCYYLLEEVCVLQESTLETFIFIFFLCAFK